MTQKLNKTQRAVLSAIQQEPGITFGLGTRKGQAACQLQVYGLVAWREQRYYDAGWYETSRLFPKQKP